jgi:hypothetical protein
MLLLQPHYSAFFSNESPVKQLVLDRSNLLEKYSTAPITILSIRHFNPYLYPCWLYASVVIFHDGTTCKVFKPDSNAYIDTDKLDQYLKEKSL